MSKEKPTPLLPTFEECYRYAKNRIEVGKLPQVRRLELDNIEYLLQAGIGEEECWVRFYNIVAKLERASKYFADKEEYEKSALIRDAILEEQEDMKKIFLRTKWDSPKTVNHLLSGLTNNIISKIWKR